MTTHVRLVNIRTDWRPIAQTESAPLAPIQYRWLLQSVPAAGWRNGTSLNNVGDNGNYWSSTPNESNAQNAYNLNFNSSNRNVNWNNRNYGNSVRAVRELTQQSSSSP